MPVSSKSKSKSKSKKGGRKGWTTPDQYDWLQGRISTYLALRADGQGSLNRFWDQLYIDWFERWPGSNNNRDQELRLKQWFNNHTRGMATPSARKKPLDLTKRSTRMLSSRQAYSKIHYRKKLKPIVDAEWERYIAENPDMERKKGERLRHLNAVVKELFDDETEDFKDEIDKRRHEGILSEDEDEGEDGAVDAIERQRRTKVQGFHRAQTRLRCTIEAVLEEIQKEAGLVGFIVVGGPEPKSGGDLMIMSAQTGTTGLGLNFSQAHSGWRTHIEEPFLAFLNSVYTREMCKGFAFPDSSSSTEDALDFENESVNPAINSNHLFQMPDDGRDFEYDAADVALRDEQQEGPEQGEMEQEEAEQEVPEQEEAEQEVPEQEDPGQTVAVPISDDDASLTSDPLSERDGWPKWFIDAIDYLQEMSSAEAWLKLLTNYVKLERKHRFTGVGRIDAKNRPSEVAIWFKNGRKYVITPNITDPATYQVSWQNWWRGLQPQWRLRDDGTLLQEVPDMHEGWEALQRGGPNGFFIIVLSFAWWVEGMDGRVNESRAVMEALNDLTWVIRRMLAVPDRPDQPIGGKRAQEGEPDTPIKKRKTE